MIGTTKYCLDPKTFKIFEATLVGINVSETGYEMCRILMSDLTTKQLELAHVHPSKEDAEAHKLRVKPIISEAEALVKDATTKVDELRIKVIGQPRYKDLADKIMGVK
jgi:hypothetical protein